MLSENALESLSIYGCSSVTWLAAFVIVHVQKSHDVAQISTCIMDNS